GQLLLRNILNRPVLPGNKVRHDPDGFHVEKKVQWTPAVKVLTDDGANAFQNLRCANSVILSREVSPGFLLLQFLCPCDKGDGTYTPVWNLTIYGLASLSILAQSQLLLYMRLERTVFLVANGTGWRGYDVTYCIGAVARAGRFFFQDRLDVFPGNRLAV